MVACVFDRLFPGLRILFRLLGIFGIGGDLGAIVVDVAIVVIEVVAVNIVDRGCTPTEPIIERGPRCPAIGSIPPLAGPVGMIRPEIPTRIIFVDPTSHLIATTSHLVFKISPLRRCEPLGAAIVQSAGRFRTDPFSGCSIAVTGLVEEIFKFATGRVSLAIVLIWPHSVCAITLQFTSINVLAGLAGPRRSAFAVAPVTLRAIAFYTIALSGTAAVTATITLSATATVTATTSVSPATATATALRKDRAGCQENEADAKHSETNVFTHDRMLPTKVCDAALLA